MKAAPTDSASYIEQMIATEKENQTSGYQKRIQELEKERKSAVLMDKVINGGDIEGYKKLSSLKLIDRANNVKKTVRDQKYKGYDRTSSKNLKDEQDLTMVSSIVKEKEIHELKNLVEHLSSNEEEKGQKFNESVRFLLDEVKSLSVSKFSSNCDKSDNNIVKKTKHSYEINNETNSVINNAFEEKKYYSKLHPNPILSSKIENEEKNIVSDSESDDFKDCIDNFELIKEKPDLNDSFFKKEVGLENEVLKFDNSVQFHVLKMIDEKKDDLFILNYLKYEMLNIWTAENIHFLDEIDLEDLDHGQKEMFFKSLR